MDPSVPVESKMTLRYDPLSLWNEKDTGYCKICVFAQCSTALWRSKTYCVECLSKNPNKKKEPFLENGLVPFLVEYEEKLLP